MKLDDRLQKVADFVPMGARVADIGTDHGYLALELYRADNSRQVIAADKNAGPCQAARKTLASTRLDDVIEVRQGDGLSALEPGEADTICIAGMGGKLIADILTARTDVLDGASTLVLQPQNAFEYLRSWLYMNGWEIIDEALAKVDGRIYQIIKAENNKSNNNSKSCNFSQAELLAGPVIVNKRPELFAEHIQALLDSLKRVENGLMHSSSTNKDTKQKLVGVQRIMNELKSL